MGESEDFSEERFASLLRFPRRSALISGVIVVVAVAVNVVVLGGASWPLWGVAVVGTVTGLLALWNVVGFSSTAMARLERLAPQVGGRFLRWKGGAGGFSGVPFAYGAEHERFGVLDYEVHGLPVEIGHLASQVAAGRRAPTGRRHAYVAVRLPERLPHMIVSFGHLSGILGVRVVPDQWHRSQRVDLGAGRRLRLFVGDGGEPLARRFLAPDVVRRLRQVGRSYDVEIEGRHLYLFGARSAAAGSERRWMAQRELIDGLAAALAASPVWEHVRRHGAPRSGTPIHADVPRALAVFFGGAAVVVVVLSLLVLAATGLLG